MASPSEALWEINNEYRKRLSQLMGHMKLLEQLLQMHGGTDPGLRAAIRRIRATLEEIDVDHHEWRHTYFYRLPEGQHKRRMVSTPVAVRLALTTFDRMLQTHLEHFDAIAQTLDSLPRPDPSLTRVIKGNDLWELCMAGAESLVTYDRFMREQLSGIPHRL